MKLLAFLLVTIFVLSFRLDAQEPHIEWTETFGDTLYDAGISVQEISDGGYITTGFTTSFGALQGDIVLLKTDEHGALQWIKSIGGNLEDGASSVKETSDSGFIIVGRTDSFGNGNGDVWLVKTDSEGDTMWSKTFGGNMYDRASSVQQTSDGGFIIAGSTFSYGSGWWDVYLIKTDIDGNRIWQKTFGGINNDNAYSVQQTIDSGYILIGTTESYGAGGLDAWLIKTDENGDEIWNKTYGESEYEFCYSGQ